MSSIPMGAYSSPQVRRAMLGQRNNNNAADAKKTAGSSPVEISGGLKKGDNPIVSPLSATGTKSPLQQAAPMAALKSPAAEESSKLQLLTPPPTALSKQVSLPTGPAVPETKEVVSLLGNLKPYFTPPTKRKQLFLQFRSVSNGQQAGGAMAAADDDPFHFNFPKGEVDIAGNVSGGRGRNRLTSDF